MDWRVRESFDLGWNINILLKGDEFEQEGREV